MSNFCRLSEKLRAIKAQAANPEVAGIVTPLAMGEFALAGVLVMTDTEMRFHRQPNHEELLVILEGEADFRVGDEIRSIRQGDFILYPATRCTGPS